MLGGRRNCVTLQHVLSFTTGAEEEPVLGFQLHPTLQFVQANTSFIPTGNTCTRARTALMAAQLIKQGVFADSFITLIQRK